MAAPDLPLPLVERAAREVARRMARRRGRRVSETDVDAFLTAHPGDVENELRRIARTPAPASPVPPPLLA